MTQQSTDFLLLQIIERLSYVVKELKQRAVSADELAKLTLSQLYYIHAIRKLGNPSLGDLAKELKVTKPSVSNGIDKLRRSGFVMKHQSAEDRRVYTVELTDKAKRLIEAEAQAFGQFFAIIHGCLSPEEFSQLTEILRKIDHALSHRL